MNSSVANVLELWIFAVLVLEVPDLIQRKRSSKLGCKLFLYIDVAFFIQQGRQDIFDFDICVRCLSDHFTDYRGVKRRQG